MQNNKEAILEQWKKVEDGEILFMIESGAFAYSVLKEWRYPLHYPIGLIVDDMTSLDDLAYKLGVFHSKAINNNVSPTEFRKILKSYHDEICILLYMPGRYSDDNMETLLEYIMNDGWGDFRLEAPVVIAFEKVIPRAYQDKFSFVLEVGCDIKSMITKNFVKEYLSYLKMFILENVQVLEYIVKEVPLNQHNRDEQFWEAVIEMMAAAFKISEKELWKKRICEKLQAAYDKAGSYEFNDQIPELFRKALDDSIPEICKFSAEDELVEVSVQQLKSRIFYDDNFYYMPDEVFVQVCKKLKGICAVNNMKYVLSENGIILSQGQGRCYMTIKKVLAGISARFVWIRREKLENEMEMTFVEIYQIRKGEI